MEKNNSHVDFQNTFPLTGSFKLFQRLPIPAEHVGRVTTARWETEAQKGAVGTPRLLHVGGAWRGCLGLLSPATNLPSSLELGRGLRSADVSGFLCYDCQTRCSQHCAPKNVSSTCCVFQALLSPARFLLMLVPWLLTGLLFLWFLACHQL